MFNIHNDRELVLLKYLHEECTLYLKSNYSYLIGKINGLVCSLYMLDIIEEPLTVSNNLDVIGLKELVVNAINLQESIQNICR